MTIEPLRYDKWIEEALRSVIRRTLAYVAAEGAPGEHHFYITFRTGDDGVRIPQHLRAQYPDEMTIVLQNQFQDLEVDRDVFLVTLKFGGKNERLRVPLSAVTAFADPSVNFGLQLKMNAFSPAKEEAPGQTEPGTGSNDVDTDTYDMPAEDEKKGGEVIALDTFRKK